MSHAGVKAGRPALPAIQPARAGYAVPMLYLASRSPRRSQLLAQLGHPFQTLALEVPEVRAVDESPHDYVRRVATDKAQAGLRQVQANDPAARVLGSDTEVVVDDRVFGKPADGEDAARMLRALSGRRHQVLTAVVVAGIDALWTDMVVSEVTFGDLDAATIAAYVASGEPLGKAGAYAIQGGAERFIAHLAGSYSGVMGLPLYATGRLLACAGLACSPAAALETATDV